MIQRPRVSTAPDARLEAHGEARPRHLTLASLGRWRGQRIAVKVLAVDSGGGGGSMGMRTHDGGLFPGACAMGGSARSRP